MNAPINPPYERQLSPEEYLSDPHGSFLNQCDDWLLIRDAYRAAESAGLDAVGKRRACRDVVPGRVLKGDRTRWPEMLPVLWVPPVVQPVVLAHENADSFGGADEVQSISEVLQVPVIPSLPDTPECDLHSAAAATNSRIEMGKDEIPCPPGAFRMRRGAVRFKVPPRPHAVMTEDEMYKEIERIGICLFPASKWIDKLAKLMKMHGKQIRRWNDPAENSSPIMYHVETARKVMDGHIEACLRVRGLTLFQLADTPDVDSRN